MNSNQLTLSESNQNLAGAFAIIRRNKFKFAFTVLLGMVLTAAYFATAPRKFSSTAKLFIKKGRESVVIDPTARTSHSGETEVFAVAELLNTRELAEEVVHHFGPDVILERESGSQSLGERLSFLNETTLNPLRVYSWQDKAVKSFQANLGVLAGKQTNVVSLAYEADSPEVAQHILKFLVDEVLEDHIRIHRTRGSEEYFYGKVESSVDKLDQLEGNLRDFKNQSGLASLPKQRDALLDLIAELRVDLLRAEFEKEALIAGLAERQAKMGEIPDRIVIEEETGQTGAVDQSLREELFALEIQEKELASKYEADNPLVRQIRGQIAEVKSISDNEHVSATVTHGPNPVYSDAKSAMLNSKAVLAEVQARAIAIRKDLEIAEKRIASFNDAELKLAKLDRDIEMARNVVKTNVELLEQARIDNELEQKRISSLNVMQSPTFVETPSNPKPKVVLGVGCLLSLIAGFGVVLLFDKRPVTQPVQLETEDRQKLPEPVSHSGV